MSMHISINSFQRILPHIPTWLLAANNAYVVASNNDKPAATSINEERLLTDIIGIGKQTLLFAQLLALNSVLWLQLQ